MIRLHSQPAAANLAPISDPDPPMSCDLMDGRDAFLTIAREKHYEFSSLRRAKLSTMALLYELHNQGKDNFVYTCNSCKSHVETRYHCSVCDVSILFKGNYMWVCKRAREVEGSGMLAERECERMLMTTTENLACSEK